MPSAIILIVIMIIIYWVWWHPERYYSRLGSFVHTQILDQAENNCQRQTL